MLQKIYFWFLRNCCTYQPANHFIHRRKLGEIAADATGTVQYLGNGKFRYLKRNR